MNEAEAKQKFMLLNLVRLIAIGFVMAGAANVAEKFLLEYSPWLGAVLLVIGLVDFFFAPMLLKRYWRKRGS
jgi:hypothetical protein